MKNIATIIFEDADANGEALVIVRASQEHVGLAVSLKEDGDIEVFMPLEAAKQLLSALQNALASSQ
ncbi:MAG TPA: hypothetical protein VFL93_05855 [Longimicrobiaceae bacterium]|nr:hypothetical protein [Longimicrobiaceae bacterium]